MSSYWHRSIIIWCSKISFKLVVRFRIKYCSDWPRDQVFEVFFSRLTDYFCLNSLLSKEKTLGLTRVDIFSADSRSESRRHGAVCETCSLAESPVYLCTMLGRLSSDSASPRFVFLAPRAAGPRDWHVFWSMIKRFAVSRRNSRCSFHSECM